MAEIILAGAGFKFDASIVSGIDRTTASKPATPPNRTTKGIEETDAIAFPRIWVVSDMFNTPRLPSHMQNDEF